MHRSLLRFLALLAVAVGGEGSVGNAEVAEEREAGVSGGHSTLDEALRYHFKLLVRHCLTTRGKRLGDAGRAQRQQDGSWAIVNFDAKESAKAYLSEPQKIKFGERLWREMRRARIELTESDHARGRAPLGVEGGRAPRSGLEGGVRGARVGRRGPDRRSRCESRQTVP